MSFNKNARKRAVDPQQESIRQHKANWNVACSAFISRLIAMKRGLNGRGDATFKLPFSKITSPLPQEVVSLLNQLASDFQKLSAEAAGIVQEQAQYSQHRLQSKKKVSNLSLDLIKKGSNPFKRFWTYLKFFGTSDQIKRLRLSLLRFASKIYYELDELENKALSLTVGSIPKALRKYYSIHDHFSNMYNVLQLSKKLLVKQEEPQEKKENISVEKTDVDEGVVQENKSNSEIAQKKKIFHSLVDILGLNITFAMNFNRLISEYEKQENPTTKELILESLRDYYDNIIQQASKELAKLTKGKTDKNISDEELVAKLFAWKFMKDKKAIQHKMNMYKLSQTFLGRALKKQYHKVNPFDITSNTRLEIQKLIREIKKMLDILMDHLHNDFDVKFLTEQMISIGEKFKLMRDNFDVLNKIYRAEFIEKDKIKRDPFESAMDYLTRKDIIQEYRR